MKVRTRIGRRTAALTTALAVIGSFLVIVAANAFGATCSGTAGSYNASANSTVAEYGILVTFTSHTPTLCTGSLGHDGTTYAEVASHVTGGVIVAGTVYEPGVTSCNEFFGDYQVSTSITPTIHIYGENWWLGGPNDGAHCVADNSSHTAWVPYQSSALRWNANVDSTNLINTNFDISQPGWQAANDQTGIGELANYKVSNIGGNASNPTNMTGVENQTSMAGAFTDICTTGVAYGFNVDQPDWSGFGTNCDAARYYTNTVQ